jgi:hypothetical protein
LGRFASPWSKAVRWAAIFVDALIVLESLVVALLFRSGGGVLSEYWWEKLLDVRYFAGHRLCHAVSRERNVPERTAPYGCVPEGVQAASAVEKAMGVLIITNPGLEFVWVRPVPLSASSSARDWPSRS